MDINVENGRVRWQRRCAFAGLALTLLFVGTAIGLAAESLEPSPVNPVAPPLPKQPESLLELLIAGGPVMIPIAACSIIALAIAVERLISLRRRRVIPDNFIDGLIAAFGPTGTNIQGALAYCDRRPSPVSNMTKAGISKLGRRLEIVEEAVEDAAAREVDRMRRGIEALGIIGTISPLLGLLGTIYGMIAAFRTAAEFGMGRAEMLAEGIYVALVTTAAGLTVAIPTLLVYYALSNKVERLADRMELIGVEFLDQCYEDAPGPVEAKLDPTSKKRQRWIEPASDSGY